MAGECALQAEGVLVEVLPNSLCRVELANGHRLLGFLPRKARADLSHLVPGERVRLEVSLYDLSVGRIVGRA